MAKANLNKEKAINFIKKNRKTMTAKQVAEKASKMFGYSKSTIIKWATYEFEFEKKDKLTLRQKLELMDKKRQRDYEKKLENEIKNRPKIRIE